MTKERENKMHFIKRIASLTASIVMILSMSVSRQPQIMRSVLVRIDPPIGIFRISHNVMMRSIIAVFSFDLLQSSVKRFAHG